MSSIKVSVLFFGQITDYTKMSSLELSDLKDTDAVMESLKTQFPSLKSSPFQLALDKEIIHENMPLHDHHTLALLPPYAGG